MRRWLVPLLLLGLVAFLACNASTFEPQSKVDTVRIFATRADAPYVKPGDRVTLEVLLGDGRQDKSRPLRHFWIPVVCLNPQDDLYYACFIPTDGGNGAGAVDGGARLIPTFDAGVGDAGAGGGNGSVIGSLPQGVDLSPFLPQGPTFSFTMPADAIIPRQGIDPYGIAIVFDIACAGHITLVARDPNGGPQQVPLQCAGDDGLPLPPSQYVIGISRVYAYDMRTNANPIVDDFMKDGVHVDATQGIVVDKCTEAKSANCPDIKLDVHVPDASWELNPSETEHDGTAFHEQIWVDYYSDVGDFTDDTRLLFDAQRGRVDDTAAKYHAPKDVSDGTVWAVVHDNRGGASWMTLPIHVK
jgi:hypothetical protein